MFREAYNISSKDYLILSHGDFLPSSNKKLLLRSFSHFLNINPLARLVLVRLPKDENYLAEIRREVRRLDIQDATRIITNTSGISDENLRDAYYAADVCVFPSVEESTGIPVLQAWAAGKPVIASQCDVHDYLIENAEECGLKFDPSTYDASQELLRKILKLYGDHQLSRSVSQNGHSRVLRQYQFSTIEKKLEFIYQRAEENLEKTRGKASSDEFRFYPKPQQN